MNMVEKISRAMCASQSGPEESVRFGVHWSQFGDGYSKIARAALEALKDPSEGMLEAASANHLEYTFEGSLSDGQLKITHNPLTCWQSMIQAALDEV